MFHNMLVVTPKSINQPVFFSVRGLRLKHPMQSERHIEKDTTPNNRSLRDMTKEVWNTPMLGFKIIQFWPTLVSIWKAKTLYPRMTNDLHVSTATSLHQSFYAPEIWKMLENQGGSGTKPRTAKRTKNIGTEPKPFRCTNRTEPNRTGGKTNRSGCEPKTRTGYEPAKNRMHLPIFNLFFALLGPIASCDDVPCNVIRWPKWHTWQIICKFFSPAFEPRAHVRVSRFQN